MVQFQITIPIAFLLTTADATTSCGDFRRGIRKMLGATLLPPIPQSPQQPTAAGSSQVSTAAPTVLQELNSHAPKTRPKRELTTREKLCQKELMREMVASRNGQTRQTNSEMWEAVRMAGSKYSPPFIPDVESAMKWADAHLGSTRIKAKKPIDWNACLSDHPGVTPALLAAEASTTGENEDVERSLEMLEGLARRGVDFNKPLPMFGTGCYPETILSRSVRDWPHKLTGIAFPHPRVVEFLLKHGADPWVPLPDELNVQRAIQRIQLKDGGPTDHDRSPTEWRDMPQYLHDMSVKQYDKVKYENGNLVKAFARAGLPLPEQPLDEIDIDDDHAVAPLKRRFDSANGKWKRICQLEEMLMDRHHELLLQNLGAIDTYGWRSAAAFEVFMQQEQIHGYLSFSPMHHCEDDASDYAPVSSHNQT